MGASSTPGIPSTACLLPAMADRPSAYGLDAELERKRNAKYSPEDEAVAREFIKSKVGVSIPAGPDNLHKALKDGVVLCQCAALRRVLPVRAMQKLTQRVRAAGLSTL